MLDCHLITNVECYTPDAVDTRHVVMAGGKIVGMLASDEAAERVAALCCEVTDGSGLLACPGFVDVHEHVCGGGGEAGPSSRTPEAQLSELLNAGITTVVGTLGTDSVCRSPECLVAKCRGLREDGITALFWGGFGYSFPPASLTGSPQRDACLLEGCVGVGELAISDHRGSFPSPLELARLAAQVRVGGMLAGRPRLVHCHVGPGAGLLQPLRDALDASGGDLPITQFLPTHMARSDELIEDGAAWLSEGGRLDLTADSAACRRAVALYHERGLPLERCSVSTDAYGSLPEFDARGRLVRYDIADPGALLRFVRAMRREEGWPLARVLPLVTRSPAEALGLEGKGRLRVGADADVLLLEPHALELRYVFSGGEIVKTPEWVRGGVFERGDGVRPRRPRVAPSGRSG